MLSSFMRTQTGVTGVMSNRGPHEYLSSSLKSKTDIRWYFVLLSVNEAAVCLH